MKKATYTKIKNSNEYKDNSLSIGFRRLTCLSKRVRKALNLNCLINKIELNKINEYQVNFFENMTEQEYTQYVVSH